MNKTEQHTKITCPTCRLITNLYLNSDNGNVDVYDICKCGEVGWVVYWISRAQGAQFTQVYGLDILETEDYEARPSDPLFLPLFEIVHRYKEACREANISE